MLPSNLFVWMIVSFVVITAIAGVIVLLAARRTKDEFVKGVLVGVGTNLIISAVIGGVYAIFEFYSVEA